MEDEENIPFLINRIKELEKENNELSHKIESLSDNRISIESPEKVVALSALIQKDIQAKQKTAPESNIDKLANLIIKYGNQFV